MILIKCFSVRFVSKGNENKSCKNSVKLLTEDPGWTEFSRAESHTHSLVRIGG